MTIYQPSLRPQHSTWGAIQSADQLLPGIWSVTTASHGGFILSENRQTAMPDALRDQSNQYEEDCDWALVVLAYEDEFQSASRMSDAHNGDLPAHIAVLVRETALLHQRDESRADRQPFA